MLSTWFPVLADGFWLTAGWALVMALISHIGYKSVGTKVEWGGGRYAGEPISDDDSGRDR